jgi:hypothetical protein
VNARALSLARPSALPFWGAAALIGAICAVMARTRIFLRAPDLVAYGTTFDLCLSIPFLYYFLVVRRRGAHPASVIPIFGLGALAARYVVPRPYHDFLHALTPLGSALEIVVLALVVGRLRRAGASLRAGAHSDPIEKIGIAVAAIFGEGRLAGAVAAEVTIAWYALFSWRRRADPERGITFYRVSGWSTVLAVLMLLIAAEGSAAHLMLARWSARAAWTFTILDVYTVFWLLGDFQALRLRPTTYDGETLRLRLGSRWSADVTASNIASVSRVAPGAFPKARDVLRFSMLDEPAYAIEFREPVLVSGMLGLSRRVRAVGVLPDQPERFESQLADFFPPA